MSITIRKSHYLAYEYDEANTEISTKRLACFILLIDHLMITRLHFIVVSTVSM